jgi:acyl carrier protein
MKEEIIETIRNVFYLKPQQIKETTRLEEVARDSMDIVELVAVLSDKYKVAIEPSKMNHIKTIGDIVEYVIKNKDTRTGNRPIESF